MMRILLLLALTQGAFGLRAGPQPPSSPNVAAVTDLTTVLSKAVNMMNSGVRQFLDGEGSLVIPPHGEHDTPQLTRS